MATDAEKVAKYREMAKDKSLPQDVRNVYLDKANALEKQAYEATKKYAKGGAVKKMNVGGALPQTMPAGAMAKPYAKGGAVTEKATGEKYASKKAMAKHEKGEGKAMQMKEKMKGKPALAIVIGVGKPKAMNKGGMAKKGKC